MNTTHDYSVLYALSTQHTLVDATLVPATKQALERLRQRGFVRFSVLLGAWELTQAGQDELDELKRGER